MYFVRQKLFYTIMCSLILVGSTANGQDALTGTAIDQAFHSEEIVQQKSSSDSSPSILLTQSFEPQKPCTIPEIPEPMFFDLVRGLGARQGELEANTLMTIPFASSTDPGRNHPFGISRYGSQDDVFEWAPEVEYALFDNIAIEFQVSFEEDQVQSYQITGQYTIGTSFNNQFIHGIQPYVEISANSDETNLACLYLFGIRFDEVWSMLAMAGFSHNNIGIDVDRTEKLINATLFAEICDSVILGVETNYAGKLNGDSLLLVLPQIHYLATERVEIQAGFGVGFEIEKTIPGFSTRAVFEF